MKKIISLILAVFAICTAFCTPALASSEISVFENYPVGDTNFDGQVKADDARRVLRSSVGLETLDNTVQLLADTDFNGTLTASDARTVLRKAVGLEAMHYHRLKKSESIKGMCLCESCDFGIILASEYSRGSEKSTGVKIEIGNKALHLGWRISQVTDVFGKYTRADNNIAGHTAYVFCIAPSRYFIAICKNEIVVGVYVLGDSFSCGGISAGDIKAQYSISGNTVLEPFIDRVYGNKVYGLLVYYLSSAPFKPNVNADFTDTASMQIFEMTNAYRTINGRKTVAWNGKIAQVAKGHSEDMAARDFFDHINPDGLSPWDRAKKQGVSFSFYCENIAAGNGISYNTFDQWVNSPPHNSGMLNYRATQLGVGGTYSRSSAFVYYWTQNFI